MTAWVVSCVDSNASDPGHDGGRAGGSEDPGGGLDASLRDAGRFSDSGKYGGGQGGNASVGDGAAGAPGAGSGGAPGTAGPECRESIDCVVPSECEFATCVAGQCQASPLQRGSRCEVGYCNGFAWCLPCLDDAPRAEQDRGCSPEEPVCVETSAEPRCVGCRDDADCGDGNDCTFDRCVDAACEHLPMPIGIPCRDGVCDGEANADSCAPCVDDAGTGVDTGCTGEQPICDTSAAPPRCSSCQTAGDCDDGNDCTIDRCHRGACEYGTAIDGTPCPDGYCNGIPGGEVCVTRRCLTDADCDDSADCTVDTCNDGSLCNHEPDHGQCPDSGDVCRPNRCTAGTGCQVVDVSRPVELLSNGFLEQGNVGWTETSDNYGQVIFVYGYVPTLQPHTSPYVGWLGGGEALRAESNSMAQTVTVPAAVVTLELSFFYQIWADDLPDFQNQLVVTLSGEEGSAIEQEVVTFYNQDRTRVWSHFSAIIDAADWAGSEAVLAFSGTSADGYTHFFVDSVELVATVCE